MISILVVLIAGANIILSVTREVRVPRDIMIVFDISLSMLAEDVSPNRITVAKNVVRNFISSRTGDRIGLIIFSGKPFVSVPFSTDYRGILSIVSGLS
ncbi:VWA domain-containing protein, partial [Candidatus Gracilibacteria bacterium]|nr:VWA domain-containing protein [Candidatus Gracilibacteria bacterium]